MKIKTAIAIVMIILAAGLTFWLFVRPMIMTPEKTARFVDEKQLFYVGNDKDGGRTFMYADLKDEIKDWTKILAPFISFGAAWLLAKKKRNA